MKDSTPQTTSTEVTVRTLFQRDDVKAKFQEMLGKRATSFITSVLQIVASNKLLATADPHSIYHSAAVAATLDLPLNNNLGFAYIVPYNQRYKDEKGIWQTKQVAQFQIGYKGFIQLAQRSGQFKSLGVTRVFEGQLIEDNPLTGPSFDWKAKKSDIIIGYAAAFSLINGFEKVTFTRTEDVKAHGKKYSQTYKKDIGLWQDEFDTMAQKTVLKLLLAKYAPLSVEMQKAVITDQALINDDEAIVVSYPDNEQEPVDKESERVFLMISDAKTLNDLKAVEPHLKDEHLDTYTNKKDELSKSK